MKNLLTQWKFEEENWKIGGNVPLIDRELAKLGNDAKCAPFPKLIELIKKLSNLIKTRKKKLYCTISHSLACFIEFVRRLCFCFAKSLIGLTDSLAMGRAELRGEKVAIGFSG